MATPAARSRQVLPSGRCACREAGAASPLPAFSWVSYLRGHTLRGAGVVLECGSSEVWEFRCWPGPKPVSGKVREVLSDKSFFSLVMKAIQALRIKTEKKKNPPQGSFYLSYQDTQRLTKMASYCFVVCLRFIISVFPCH